MAVTKVSEARSEADVSWGYKFGCEGVVNLKTALTMMADCGKNTLLRRVEQKKIRMGIEGRRRVFCVKSILQHIASIES